MWTGGVNKATRSIEAAATTGITSFRLIRAGGNFLRQSVFVGATTRINNNAAAPFRAGYHGPYGASDAVNQAATVIQAITYLNHLKMYQRQRREMRKPGPTAQVLVYRSCQR
jgi:hypothetical protein